jgi:chloramphenicol 3-O phosphotransferase
VLDDYLVALDGCDVVFVGITAPLEVIEQREAERGDRFVGQARGHYETVHRHGQYDILLDTQESTINEGVATILDRLDAGRARPSGS